MTETPLQTSNGILRFLYDFNHAAITRNTEGMTQEESLVSPPRSGNCANWVLGHILHNRSFVLLLVNEQPLWAEADGAPYAMHSQPLAADDARPFAEMLQDLELTQERLRRGLEQLPPADLDLKHEEGAKRPRGAQLHFMHFHEAYHAGQLGLLRRIVGKPGAI